MMGFAGTPYTPSLDYSVEDEFMIFDRVARGLTGKMFVKFFELRYPVSTSKKNLAQMGGGGMPLPPEVGRIVAHKFNLVASISDLWSSSTLALHPCCYPCLLS